MRLIFTPEMEKLQSEVDPYIVMKGTDVTYKEGTPKEIIQKHKQLMDMLYQIKKDEAFA